MSDRLRFCMVTTYYPPYNFGGDGIFVRRLSHELARRGHHVEVIHSRDAYRLSRRGEPKEPYDDPPGVVVHGLESRFRSLSPLVIHQTGAPLLQGGALRRILNQGFDVIHFHNVSLVGGPHVLTFGEGVKLYTAHEYWLVCPTHVLFRYNRAPCHRPHCTLCCLAYRRPPQAWRHYGLLPSSLEHLDALITPSRFSQEVHGRLGISAPVVHLPLFLPASSFQLPEGGSRAERERPYFLYAGRLEKLKGPQTLIPVFRRHTRARLLVAGAGGSEGFLRGQAADCANIEFVGPQTHPDLLALYRGAMALIVPSINFEVFPQVMIEALAQGTPVIARNLGSLPEIVAESGGGFTYDNEEELVAILDRLLDHPSLRDDLGRRGRKAAERSWSADTHIARYMDLIYGLRAGRKP